MEHHHKFNPQYAEKLISSERVQSLKPEILIQKLCLEPGSTLLDIGCGNGFLTFLASAAVGTNGIVVAADLSDTMLKALKQRNPPENVKILKTGEVKIDLEDNSVDAIIAVSMYHEFKNISENFIEWKRVLKPKPEAKLLLLDWIPGISPEIGPKHRISREKAISEIETSECFSVDHNENYTFNHWLIIAHPI